MTTMIYTSYKNIRGGSVMTRTTPRKKEKKFYFTLKGRNFVDMSSTPTSI